MPVLVMPKTWLTGTPCALSTWLISENCGMLKPRL